MPHHTPLIATIVGGLVLAFIFGTLAHRLKMPPLIGYLVAGIAIGPFTPGFVGDAAARNVDNAQRTLGALQHVGVNNSRGLFVFW